MPEDVSDIEADRAMLDWLQSQIRTSLPAIVTSYNPQTNRAAVKLTRKNRQPDGRTWGPTEVQDLPVRWPRGGGWVLRWELAKGDECSITVMDRSFQEWISTGKVSDPVWRWKHAITDSVVEPGLSSATNPLPGGNGVLWLGREDGSATIKIDKTGGVEVEGTLVKLGAGATLGVARLNDAVSPTAAMTAWALVVETAINALAPLTFTPANSFAGTVQAAFASISQASAKAKAE